jgi:hypothetical protein
MPTHPPTTPDGEEIPPRSHFFFTTARLLKIIDGNVIFSPLVFLVCVRLFFSRAQVVIDLGAAPLDGEADWYTLTSHEESLQILVSPIPFSPFFYDVSNNPIERVAGINKNKSFGGPPPHHYLTSGWGGGGTKKKKKKKQTRK